jgi:hypothetical protein
MIRVDCEPGQARGGPRPQTGDQTHDRPATQKSMDEKPVKRHAIRLFIGLALGAAALSACQTIGGQALSPVAIAGTPLRLGHFASLNPDCSPLGEPVVRVTKPADHGFVAVQAAEGYTNYVAANPREHCNYSPTRGTNAIYTSQRGYLGADSVALDVIFPSGLEQQFRYTLEVK